MTTNAYAITGEYTDARGPAAYASTDAGSVTDADPLPPNGCTEPATGPALGRVPHRPAAAARARAPDHGRPPAGRRRQHLLPVRPAASAACPTRTASACALGGAASGYCGYHASTVGGVLYAVIPYNAVSGHCQSSKPRPNANTADPALSTISHEQGEMVTDPYGTPGRTRTAIEIGDVCLPTFGRALGGSGAPRGMNGSTVTAIGCRSSTAACGRLRAAPPSDSVSIAGHDARHGRASRHEVHGQWPPARRDGLRLQLVLRRRRAALPDAS